MHKKSTLSIESLFLALERFDFFFVQKKSWAYLLVGLLFGVFCGNAHPKTTEILPFSKKEAAKFIQGKGEEITFRKEPESIAVCIGKQARFEVDVASKNEKPFQVQWQTSLDNGKNWLDAAGETGLSCIAVLSANRAHHGLRVRARVRCADKDFFSRIAVLFIQDMLELDENLSDQISAEGGTVTFSPTINLSALPDKTYFQWQKMAYSTGVWENIRGENQINLKLQGLQAKESANQYRLMAYGPGLCDSIYSSMAMLRIIPQPKINVTPGQNTFCGGGSATFSVLMQGGTGLEKIQWQCSKNEGKTFEDLPGAVQKSYFLAEISPKMTGFRYRAVVHLPGEVRLVTHEAIITVYGAVAFSEKPKNQTVCYGDQAIFRVKANYEGGKPAYQWELEKNGDGKFEPLPDQISEELIIRTDSVDVNNWRVRALVLIGACNSIESEPAKLNVLSSLNFLRHPSDAILAYPEDDAHFLADFEGNTSLFSIGWEWSANDGATWQGLPNSNGLSLKVPRVQQEMLTNLYRMRVMNKQCGRIFYSNPASIKMAAGN